MPDLIPADGDKPLPKQNVDLIVLLAERFDVSAGAHRKWAEPAKECVDFCEGRQWTADQLAALELQGRPALQFNKIRPLVRLVAGYHRNNRTDFNYFPTGEGPSNEQVGEVITATAKHASENTQLEFIDAEVFLDGIVSGRGYFEDLMDFTDNIHGVIRSRAVDPFTVYLDPSAQSYDLDKDCNYINKARWVSIDEIEYLYGKTVSDHLNSIATGNTAWSMFPQLSEGATDPEITPQRGFGQDDDAMDPTFSRYRDLFDEYFVDRYRKNIRVLDTQYYVTVDRRFFVDLETGQTKPIPDHWDAQKIQKALLFAQEIGNPLRAIKRKTRRVRWTIIVGDIIIYDSFSPYKTYTIRPFFPWFRRGITEGMVHDLRDPQKEVNKRRMAEIEIVSRTANSGWMYEEGALNAENEEQLELFGSMPGINIKYNKDRQPPEKIDPNPPPTAMERLEDKARDDLQEISSVNKEALGADETVKSGRAIEARQRQAVIGLQMYMDNFRRTKEMQGRKYLELIQNWYTEERVFRVLGEDGRRTQIVINQRTVERMLNDVTIGDYGVGVDETPMAASFENAQFEEMLLILEKLGPVGQALLQTRPDLLVDASSLPRKEEWTEALRAALGVAQQQPGPVDPNGNPMQGHNGGPPIEGGPVIPGTGPANGPALDAGTAPGGNVVVAQPGGEIS